MGDFAGVLGIYALFTLMFTLAALVVAFAYTFDPHEPDGADLIIRGVMSFPLAIVVGLLWPIFTAISVPASIAMWALKISGEVPNENPSCWHGRSRRRNP